MRDLQSFCHWKANFHWITHLGNSGSYNFQKVCINFNLSVHVYLVHKIVLGDQSKFTVANCLREKETSLLGES